MAATFSIRRMIRRSPARDNAVRVISRISAVVRGRRTFNCSRLPRRNGLPTVRAGGEGRFGRGTAVTPSTFPAGGGDFVVDRVVLVFTGMGGLAIGVSGSDDTTFRLRFVGVAACWRRVRGWAGLVTTLCAACRLRSASAPSAVVELSGSDRASVA